jgi:hypothetical protein
MRIVASVVFFAAFLGIAGTASTQTPSYTWADIDCRESRIVAWTGLKCRATNVVTGDGNIGVFRQWTTFGTGRDGYYVHIFLWEAQNNFSYLAADETTAQFAKWMFEHGQSVIEVSPVARYKDADFVTFKDGKHDRRCVGFRRLGSFQRGGYASVTGGILCASPGKTITDKDIGLFIDNVRLQEAAS